LKEVVTQQILDLLEEGNKAEFLKLVYNYREECVRHLLRKTNSDRDHAEDIFIEAVMNLWEKAGKKGLAEIDNVKAYLLGTCYTMWKNLYNKDKKRKEAVPDVERYFYDYLDEFDITENPARLKDRLLDISQQALLALGDKCRNIIKYFYFEKKNMEEIAELMNFNSAEVVSSTKYRCFKELRTKALKLEKSLDQQDF